MAPSSRCTTKLSFIRSLILTLLISVPGQSFSNFGYQLSSKRSLKPNVVQSSVAAVTATTPSSSTTLLLAAESTDNNSIDKEDLASSSINLLEQLAKRLAQSEFQKIVVVIGAGMSVSAGIPDFRTKGTGLYSKLEEYNLPYPEAIFELGYFRQNPQPFVDVAKAIWPGQETGPKPTLAHSFVALLEQRGLLKRVYTQNIDGLERLAGVSDDRLIECHGHFSTCSCIAPGCSYKQMRGTHAESCRDACLKGEVLKCPECDSLVKPDIVFFGEELPSVFMDYIDQDMDDCDLLVVMGTSLLVAPVASIPNWVGRNVPRLLINRELVGSFAEEALMAKAAAFGGRSTQNRDVSFLGDCDDGVRAVCEFAGKDWVEQLDALHDATSPAA